MTEIRLTCKCKYCKDYEPFKCHECLGTGKTVMEFEWSKVMSFYYSESLKISVQPPNNIRQTFWIMDSSGKDITESRNPLFLEVVEEQECPECEGKSIQPLSFRKSGLLPLTMGMPKCKNCTDGKIEVVTQFTVFGSKDEYYKGKLADMTKESKQKFLRDYEKLVEELKESE